MAMNDQAIREQFQRILGRDARADEVQVFNEFLRENDLTPFEIGQIIESHPEYQTKLLGQQGQQYSDLLGASDAQILGKAQSAIGSQFARMGRPSSSGYTSAFSNAARDLAMARQGQLASFYGQGLGGIRNVAQTGGANALQRGYGLRDERRQRGWAIDDFYMEKNSFNDYLNQQNKRNRNQFIGQAAGMAGGAALGFGLGGPMGARYGAQLGGLFGQSAGGL